ncbi:hypothetical protein [Planctobacterium marinum]
MKIFDDESLQSAVYRLHLVHGLTQFTNVISPKGEWKGFPRIKAGTLGLYGQIGEKRILKMLQRQGLVSRAENRFDLPHLYQKELTCFFRKPSRIGNRVERNIPINYCTDCVRDSIERFGVGYFKSEWLKHGYCNIHNKPLNKLPKTSLKESLRCLEVIMRGIKPSEYANTLAPKGSDYIYKQKKLLYFAPCWQEDFIEFIKSKRFLFGEEVDKHLRFSIVSDQLSEDFLEEIYVVKDVYEALVRAKSAYLSQFISKGAEIKTVGTGVLRKSSIKQRILKNKMKACQSCDYISCPANEAG